MDDLLPIAEIDRYPGSKCDLWSITSLKRCASAMRA